MRVTSARLTILKTLRQTNTPRTVQELLRDAQCLDYALQLAAVYRTLSTFRKAGLIRTSFATDGQARYTFEDGEERIHLADAASGNTFSVLEPAAASLAAAIAKRFGLEMQSFTFEILATSPQALPANNKTEAKLRAVGPPKRRGSP